MKRILALVAAALLAVGVFGGAVAAVAASEPAKSYGGCVSKSTGYLRILERNNLAKSSVGKCKSTERRITVPSTSGLIKGDKGATGASAFEVWRDLKLADGTQPNKAKTEADYLASLKGDTGPKGADGKDGATGPQGPKGDPGRGLDGAPFKMTFAGNGPWTCSWQADTETLACVTPAS
ncbi:collagen-like triple helix repeat-containing protein [Microbispora sp. ATCC PTA-5024]|uniref:collagen-like triple helix repeat-containing protein n=1 Tax=Microbispora sp. ATCC PTA-5024 TaxID=316330 RepID=UPI0003DB72C2|nr:collagen-like protein [Microbispora sp. ATCC PTA-5024]ETK36108.1 hypothetical protein MPTA5024_10815 [Microbispora sp. ATCC PTA-5024]